MAITPMQLPSPKAYDPNQMEMTNLALFKDPYTASGASVRDSQLQLERQLNNEAYAHAVEGQQSYYNKALDLQAEESANELLPKLLHEQHGIGFASGIRGLQGVLERMQQANPGLYGQYVNQAFQGEKAKAFQAGGAGAKSFLEAGHLTSPDEAYGATGVHTTATTPLSLQEAAIRAASGGDGEGSGGVRFSVGLPSYNGAAPTVSLKGNVAEADWKRRAVAAGLMKPGDTVVGAPPPGPSAVPGLPHNPAAKPLPQQQTRDAPAKGGATASGGPNRTAQWEQIKPNMPPDVAAAVERARKMNGGKVLFDEKTRTLYGANPDGTPRAIPVPR